MTGITRKTADDQDDEITEMTKVSGMTAMNRMTRMKTTTTTTTFTLFFVQKLDSLPSRQLESQSWQARQVQLSKTATLYLAKTKTLNFQTALQIAT